MWARSYRRRAAGTTTDRPARGAERGSDRRSGTDSVTFETVLRLTQSPLCPFAHRTLALLEHLDVDHESVEIDLDDRPRGFLDRSPTGRVPMLEEGELLLYESRVINEYLAEREGWESAYPADVGLRARHRLAMKQWDAVVIDAWYPSLGSGEIGEDAREPIRRELAELAATVADPATRTESLLGFHCATHWVRMRILDGASPLPGWVESGWPPLATWLDRSADVPAIGATLPDPGSIRAGYARYLEPASRGAR